MHVLVLTRNRYLYATRRIISTLFRLGHRVSVADPLTCSVRIGANGERDLDTPEGKLTGLDAVIGRSSPVTRDAIVRILRFLEPTCPIQINPPTALTLACDKFLTLSVLAAAGLPVPPSRLVHSDAGVQAAIDDFGGKPTVIKTLDGSRGRGVCIADSPASIMSVAQALLDEGASLMLQHYYAESAGRDLRAFVIGGQLVAVASRAGKSGDFRANAHCGGTMTAVTPSSEISRLAVHAVTTLGLEVAGVDILETNSGPVVLEVNGTPGLRGIEESTDTDIALLIARHLESRLTP